MPTGAPVLVATVMAGRRSHSHRRSERSQRTHAVLHRLEEPGHGRRNDRALTTSARDQRPTGSHLDNRRGHVAMCAATAKRTRGRWRQIKERPGEWTPIVYRDLDRPAAALNHQDGAKGQRPVGGRHCSAVEYAPGGCSATAQAVTPAVVSRAPGETMRLGHRREREKDDAGRDNAFHAGSLGYERGAATASPLR
jgi:hypothetical protein